MSPARGEGLRLLGGMLTVEPGTGREGGTSFNFTPPKSLTSERLRLHSVLTVRDVCRAGYTVSSAVVIWRSKYVNIFRAKIRKQNNHFFRCLG